MKQGRTYMFLPSGQKRAPYGVIYYRLALLVASSLLPVDGKPSPVKSRGLFVLFEWRGVKGKAEAAAKRP